MYFRRTGRQDDLRRTVSGALPGYALAVRRRKTSQPQRRLRWALQRSRSYGDAEFLDELPRLADFVPTSVLPFLLLFLTGLAAIAGLAACFLWIPIRTSAFDLAGSGSLATWLGSLLLALASVTAGIVHSVRRFRLDDYRNHYRIWLWAACCWLLLSVDHTANLRCTLKDLLVATTGTRLYGDGSLWWIAVYVFLLGGVGSRLLIDMRHNWASSATLLMAGCAYLAALAVRFDIILASDPPTQKIVVQQGGVLLGGLLLFLSMGLHARYVLLDATGLLPLEEDEVEGRSWIPPTAGSGARNTVLHSTRGLLRSQPPLVRPPSVNQVATALNTLAATAEAANSMPAGGVNRRLTKEERRRLEERLRRRGSMP